MPKSVKLNLYAFNAIVIIIAMGIIQIAINIATLQFNYVKINVKQILFGIIGVIALVVFSPITLIECAFYEYVRGNGEDEEIVQTSYKQIMNLHDLVNKDFNTAKFIKGIPFTKW